MLIDSTAGATVVIGLGNPLMADDGIGIAALDRLRERGPGGDVELVDGGTWGMTLLPVVESAGRLLLLDAIDTGCRPGTLITLERERIPRYLSTKISPHQVALHDVLALAELRGKLPDQTVALGIQPERVEMSVGLTATVAAQMDGLVALVLERLALWQAAEPTPAGRHA